MVASAGHDGRGLRHAAPLGAGILAARMGPAHQKSDRRASSDALLALSRRRGKYAARSNARQEQLRIAAAAAVVLLAIAICRCCWDRCCKPRTGRGGAQRRRRHRMDFFCRIFGALAASESQGGKHQAGQRVGAHGLARAQPARTVRRRARAWLLGVSILLPVYMSDSRLHKCSRILYICHRRGID